MKGTLPQNPIPEAAPPIKAVPPEPKPVVGTLPERERKGLARRLLGRFHIYGVFWYRFHLWGVRHAPTWLLLSLLPFFTLFFSIVLVRIRRAIAANYEVVLGPCGFFERQRRIFLNLWNYAWCLNERYETIGIGKTMEVTPYGEENWHEIAQGENGFLIATAHLGPWEAASFNATSHGRPRKVHIVREAEIEADAQRFFEELLLERGFENYTVHFVSNQAQLGPNLLFALRRGEVVALQGDRPAHGGKACDVTVFGKTFKVPVGPLALARSAEVPIVPVFAYRTGRLKADLRFEKPIWVERTDNRDADLQKAAASLAIYIEEAIRRRPFQWFCFRPGF